MTNEQAIQKANETISRLTAKLKANGIDEPCEDLQSLFEQADAIDTNYDDPMFDHNPLDSYL